MTEDEKEVKPKAPESQKPKKNSAEESNEKIKKEGSVKVETVASKVKPASSRVPPIASTPGKGSVDGEQKKKSTGCCIIL